MKKFITRLFNIQGVLLIFILVSIPYLDLPGLNMDSVSPDYIVEHIRNPNNVPAWIYTDNIIASINGKTWSYPLLNSLYGTNFSAYLSLPIVALLGNSLFTVRICHILFGVLMIIAVYILGLTATDNKKFASILCLLISIEPTIVFAQRTQFYLQLFPVIFFFLGLAILLKQIEKKSAIRSKNVFGASVLFGLAACSYFIFAGYYAAVFLVFFIYIISHKYSWKLIFSSITGFFIGYIPFLYAHISICIQTGFKEYLQLLKGVDSAYGLTAEKTGVLGAISDFIKETSALFSGNEIITLMTQQNVAAKWSGTFLYIVSAILVFISFIYVINALLKRQMNKTTYTLAFLNICIMIHFIIALIVGPALRYQHYIMLIPIVFTVGLLVIFVIFKEKYQNQRSIFSLFVGGIVSFVIILNMVNLHSGYKSISDTGGTGYFSESINSLSEYLKSNVSENDVIISPQWGYWMSIAIITEGKYTIWDGSNLDVLHARLESSTFNRLYIVDDNSTNDDIVDAIIKISGKTVINKIPFSDRGGNLLGANLIVAE